MHTPNKIKTNKDMIRKSIISNPLLEGAWILEPKPRQGKMDDIVIKGQSLPNHIVMNGGISQPNK